MTKQQAAQLEHLTTEARNPASANIDTLDPLEIVHLMNTEDAQVAKAVRAESKSIAAAIRVIASRLQAGGRLIYLGAGTSGRLGVLDASECPPTFGTPPEMVVGLIAGGNSALTRSVEGAEDDPHGGRNDLNRVGVSKHDVVVGIATSGRTPYVVGGLAYSKSIGAATIGISCNFDSELRAVSQTMIIPVVGPEVISGSTRLKAGTATKMVLNMLTTGSMIRLGKTFGNLMVDLTVTNEKLSHRARRIVAELTGLDAPATAELLRKCGGEVKTAIVSYLRKIPPEQARLRISAAKGHLRDAIQADTTSGDRST